MESNLRSTNRPGLPISLSHSVVMVLLFLGIDGTVVSAQTLSISGQVIGGDNKERLPYANVKIKGTNIGTQTNLQGFS